MSLKSLGVLLGVFSIPFFASGREKNEPFVSVINSAQQGIAAVVVPGPEFFGLSVGTAFFVSDEYLLTAAHVIKDRPNSSLYIPILVPNSSRLGGMDTLEFEVTEVSDDFDVALLKLKTRAKRKVLPFKLAVGTLPAGTEVAVTGFGSLANYPLTFTGFVASQGAMYFGLGLQQPLPEFGKLSSVFVVDRPLPSGFSGAPVFVRGSGVVYGIAVETKRDLNSGAPAMSLAHPLRKARELLEKHHVPYLQITPSDAAVSP
jgi:S1-C subfamily serine protease